MEAKDIGPLDWRIAITDRNGKPTPEFQRRWNSQRGNNTLIGTITFGSGVPSNDPVPADGALYADTDEDPVVLYVGFEGVWNKAGVSDFIELDDVPNTYVAQSGKIVRVKSDELGLEFVVPTANPTAIAGPLAINGSATTFMRSDAAPAIQEGSASIKGIVQVDGSTITAIGGVISAAGSGGGNTFSRPNNQASWGTGSTSAFATKGNLIVAAETFTIDRVYLMMASSTTGQTYRAGLYEINNSLVIQSVVGVTPTVTATATAITEYQLTFASPVTLTKGSTYIIAITGTNFASGTTVLSIGATASSVNTVPNYANLPIGWVFNSNNTGPGSSYTLASLNPAVGNTFIVNNIAAYAIGLRAKV